ncbi:MAG: hypothetical protein CL832_00280 [Crocinitomicaceae bacterium]|nr:hypothetical protein [Crocinitomicaceae bacterium]
MLTGIVILGGNKLAHPAISHITKLGYHTIVVDQYINKDLRKICCETIQENFFDSKKLILALQNKSFKAIIPLNDFAVLSAAIAIDYFELIGYSIEAAKNVSQKFRLKNCWINSNIKTPYSITITKQNYKLEIQKWNIYPCILKPSFAGGGSRDVLYCENSNELTLKHQYIYNKYKNIVIEEFISGSEHSAEVLVSNGKIQIISISDKFNYVFSKTVVQDLQFPGNIGITKIDALKNIFFNACKSLGIKYGAAHFEFIINENDKIYLLEVGGRPGGGLNFFPISFISFGIDYPKLLIKVLLKQNLCFDDFSFKTNLYWHFFNVYDGVLNEVYGLNEVLSHEDVVKADIFVKIGEYRNGDLKNDMQRTGYVLFKYDDNQDLTQKINYFNRLIKFEVL